MSDKASAASEVVARTQSLHQCRICGTYWRLWIGNGWSLADTAQKPCKRCDNSPEFLSLLVPQPNAAPQENPPLIHTLASIMLGEVRTSASAAPDSGMPEEPKILTVKCQTYRCDDGVNDTLIKNITNEYVTKSDYDALRAYALSRRGREGMVPLIGSFSILGDGLTMKFTNPNDGNAVADALQARQLLAAPSTGGEEGR